MSVDRRTLLGFSAAGVAYPLGSKVVQAAPSAVGVFGVDASMFGVRPDALDDQSAALQRAIDAAARHRVPLMLPPGLYRASDLVLPSGSQIFGVLGGSRLVLG